MNTIDNKRLKIWSVVYNDQCMLKFKMLLKGSQFYYYSNTVFDTFVLCLPQYPVLIWGMIGSIRTRQKCYKCWQATETV